MIEKNRGAIKAPLFDIRIANKRQIDLHFAPNIVGTANLGK